MATAFAPQVGICPEYQRLLHACQEALAKWQQLRTFAERDSFAELRARKDLQRLKGEYARAYFALESHEQFCQACQYVAKVGGLDFESMSFALSQFNQIS